MLGRWIVFASVLWVSSALVSAQGLDFKASPNQPNRGATEFSDAVEAHVERLEQALDERLAEVAAGHGAESLPSWIEQRLDTLLWLEARARSKDSRPAIRSLGRLLIRFEDVASHAEAQPDPDVLSLEIQGSLRAATAALAKLGGGAISGTVTDHEDGTPLVDTVVALRTLGTDLLQTTTTDDSGRYQLTDVAPGRYHVHTQSRTHRNESYDDRPCAPGAPRFLISICDVRYYTVDFSAGHPVGVEAGSTTAGVDFALDPLPKIRGRVVHGETGEPRPNAAIEASLPTLAVGTQRAIADFDGYYELTGLRKGHWLVSAFSGPLVGELYDDVPCLQGLSIDCYSQQATPVFTDFRLPAEGIDFALSPSSSGVEGRVFDETTGLGIPFARVLIYEADGEVYFRALADELGRYGAALVPGTYRARVFADSYPTEIYGGASCGRYECDLESGTPIVVDDSGVVTGVDFGLTPGGSISGAIRDTFGNHLFGLVNVYDAEGRLWAQDFTDPVGFYSATGLAEASYFAVGGASSSQGWKTQVYRGQPCSDFPCPLDSATPIAVSAGQDTEGIDFALESRQTISGHLVDEQSGEPIPFARVSLYSQDGEFLRDVMSDASGFYRHIGVDFSPAYVVATPEEFVPQIHPGVPCPFQICDVSLGDGIEVPVDGAVMDIDFSLARGAGIEGTVRLAGKPLAGASVSAFDALGRLVDTVESDVDGRYRVGGLLDGDYFLVLERFSWAQVYPNMDCRTDCDPLSGEPVSIVGASTRSGVDFNLERRGFISGRITDTFGRPLSGVEIWIREVHLDETISNQITGSDGFYGADRLATGVYEVRANKTTYSYTRTDPFSIQDPGGKDDLDLQLPHKRGISGRVVAASSGLPVPWVGIDIWSAAGEVYSQGLTSVDGRYSVFVPDGQWYVSTDNRRGGLDKVYPEALCPAGPVIAGACDPRTGDPVTVDTELVEGIDFVLEGIDVFDCTPSETVLCLNEGRFRVETVWRDAQGQGTPGRRGLLTNDSAYFWFFDDDNIEVLVKVLDACGTSSNRFWVFAAGLTNVDVSLVVTDTATGRSKEYRNPSGTDFQPILDTDAFNACNVGFQGSEGFQGSQDAESIPQESPVKSIVDPLSFQAELEGGVSKTNGSCEPADGHLCLSGNRFQAELTFRAPQSTEQAASAVQLTDDSGYFWFFNSRNIEVMVKVLDACVPPFERFWVFSAGLTNLEVELRVTDTVSGEVRTYNNPANSPFAPIFDVSAFDTCG